MKRKASILEFDHDILAAPPLDRLFGYESNLERAFDRSLNQLERLQRICKETPVSPALHVKGSK